MESVKTVERNNSGYSGLILSVFVILAFVVYAVTQLSDISGVESQAYGTALKSRDANTEAVWRKSSSKQPVPGIYRRGSAKIRDAKQLGSDNDARPTGRQLFRQRQ